jgi:CRP/FNR family transcriptional regulator
MKKYPSKEGSDLMQVTRQCEHCQHKLCAKRVPIFSAMSTEEINEITDLIIRKSYVKGEAIMTEGETIDRLVIINSGKAKGCKYSIDGKEQILYLYSEGDFFGERNLLTNLKASYSIVALETVHVCMILKADIRQLIKKHPEIGLKIMEELTMKLERLENTIEQMGTRTVEIRVIGALLEFAEKFGMEKETGRMVALPLSREGIASYIGVTRETVSRSMNALDEEGLIQIIGNKKVFIENVEALKNRFSETKF